MNKEQNILCTKIGLFKEGDGEPRLTRHIPVSGAECHIERLNKEISEIRSYCRWSPISTEERMDFNLVLFQSWHSNQHSVFARVGHSHLYIDKELLIKILSFYKLSKRTKTQQVISIENAKIEFVGEGMTEIDIKTDVRQLKIDASGNVFLYVQSSHDSSDQLETTTFNLSELFGAEILADKQGVDVWSDFVEVYFPDFLGGEKIALFNNLQILVDYSVYKNECPPLNGSSAESLYVNKYKGDVDNFEIEIDYLRTKSEILEEAIKSFLKTT